MDYSAAYIISIPAAAVQDPAGNELTNSYTFSFTTETYVQPLAPVITPAGGTFNTTQVISISNPNTSVVSDVYYNLNGIMPTVNSIFYTGPFTITQTCTVTAAVYDSSIGKWSTPSSATFTITSGGLGDTVTPTWLSGSELSTMDVTQNSLTLVWGSAADNVGVTGYKIYQNGTVLTTLDAGIQKYELTGLTAGTSYNFKIEAGDAAGNWSTIGPSTTVVTEKTEGCFIATAAFGSYLDPHVWVLRNFRDRVLLKFPLGKLFVAWYYRNSPPIAAVIDQSEPLRFVTRLALTPLIYTVEYPKVSTTALLFTGVILLALRKRRRLQKS
jgi:hypothetical protein